MWCKGGWGSEGFVFEGGGGRKVVFFLGVFGESDSFYSGLVWVCFFFVLLVLECIV